MLPLWNILSGTAKEIPPRLGTASSVDVRDVAAVHVWAYENPHKADGERYICLEGYGPPQAVADILRKKYEGTKIGEKIFVGSPGEDYIGYNKTTGEVDSIDYLPGTARPVGHKAEREIGIKWIPFKQSVIDTAEALEPLL
jgi:nucleoside-diphosphate-sugar epimerase